MKTALALTSSGSDPGDITSKGGRDLVTTTDVAVEDTVRAHLQRALGITVIGEERGGKTPSDGAAYWLVDPICGTRNFASGIPLFALNLALVEHGEVTVAVVGDPSRDEIVVAERGLGVSTLTASSRWRIAVSEASHVLVAEDGKAAGPRREHAADFIMNAIRVDEWDFRSLGTTLSFPYLAAGRVAAYVVFYYSPAVHSAAGSLLATEAGALLTDIEGKPWNLESDSLISAATPRLQERLVELARQTKPGIHSTGHAIL